MRVTVLVADGLGVGEAPDAKRFGDLGSDTLGHVLEAAPQLALPNLEKLGLGYLTRKLACPDSPLATVARLTEKSEGKDTTTGHWELAGLVTRKAFPTFESGFPQKLIDDFIQAAGLKGVLANRPASGTTIIRELGETSVQTGLPIVYTSADSVFQIAAHETHFGLDRLYRVCEIARKLTLPLGIGRVIARPFIGSCSSDFVRTEHRRDYSIAPPPNALDTIYRGGVPVCSVGKIEDIFDHRSITEADHTGNNRAGLDVTLKFLRKYQNKHAFVFANLIDFDQLYGHRRDPQGFARSLDELDRFIPNLIAEMAPEDLLLLTADHGCDPTFKGTDHTREFVPCVCYSPSRPGRHLSTRNSFTDVAATILSGFELSTTALPDLGTSLYEP